MYELKQGCLGSFSFLRGAKNALMRGKNVPRGKHYSCGWYSVHGQKKALTRGKKVPRGKIFLHDQTLPQWTRGKHYSGGWCSARGKKCPHTESHAVKMPLGAKIFLTTKHCPEGHEANITFVVDTAPGANNSPRYEIYPQSQTFKQG